MGRAPCCDKANVKKGPWSPEEDLKLKDYIHKYGTGGNWISLPQKAGLRRCGKSCRLRWLNYLRPNIKHGEFSDEEDRIICTLFASIGSRWSIMAAHLPGRTDNDIKNYWNTKLKKKLLAMQLLPPSPPPPLLSSPSSSSFHHLETAQHTSSPSPSSLHRDYNPMLMMSPYDYHHHTLATPFLQNHGHYYQEDAVKENYNGSREIKQEEGIGVYMPSNDTNIGENSNEALFCNSWFDHNPIMMNNGCFGQTHQLGLLQEDVLHAEMEEPLGIGTCNSGFFFSGGESKATASTSTSTGYQSEEVVMYH